MSDEADLAGPAVAAFQAQSLAPHLARAEAEARRPVNASGRCRDCRDAIEADRLAADPRAQRCMSCQEDHERGNRCR